jgi:poly(glycerol-phosphate) alpha-glucosyltransferase
MRPDTGSFSNFSHAHTNTRADAPGCAYAGSWASSPLLNWQDPMNAHSSKPGVAFVFGTIAVQRGGVTRAVLNRAKLYAEADVPVRLLLTGFSHYEDREASEIRRLWQLPDSLDIRYFWREAAPGGGGFGKDPVAEAYADGDLVPVRIRSGVLEFFHDGMLDRSIRFDDDQRVQTVIRYDQAQRVIARDNYDIHGKLIFTEHVAPDKGYAAYRRWFDASGRCWLTMWLSRAGSPTRAVRHHPATVAYDHIGECIAAWVSDVTSNWPRAVVMVDGRQLDPVLLSLRGSEARTVATLHNCHTQAPHSSEEPTKASYRILFSSIDEIDAVVTLTHRQRHDIAERTGATNLRVINHGIRRVRIAEGPRQEGLLVAISRFDEQKRLDHAIRAFARTAAHLPDTQFQIYGKGKTERQLSALIKELEMSDRIILRGFTDRPLEVFASATATILSSVFEGLPLVLTEAMSVGTPFVAYDVNYGPSEVIRHEVDGLLVPSGDVDALAHGLIRILGDPGYAAQLGRRAREVTDRFSAERWATSWLHLYDELADTSITSRQQTTIL